jgi:integrase
VPHFGERSLDRIEPEHVEAYMHAKLATLSSKTVTNHLTFMHGLFAFSIRRRWAKPNPVALVDRPPAMRQHARRIRFLQRVEVEALLRAVPDDELGPTDGTLYLCAVTTGLRQGELLALKWLDVDWVARRFGWLTTSREAVLILRTRQSRITCARSRWPTGWQASSSATSSDRRTARTTTSSSAIRRRASSTTPRR